MNNEEYKQRLAQRYAEAYKTNVDEETQESVEAVVDIDDTVRTEALNATLKFTEMFRIPREGGPDRVDLTKLSIALGMFIGRVFDLSSKLMYDQYKGANQLDIYERWVETVLRGHAISCGQREDTRKINIKLVERDDG